MRQGSMLGVRWLVVTALAAAVSIVLLVSPAVADPGHVEGRADALFDDVLSRGSPEPAGIALTASEEKAASAAEMLSGYIYDSSLSFVAPSTARFGPTNPGPLHSLRNADTVVSSFRSGSYTEVVLQEQTTLYRVYGGSAAEIGPYWTRTAPSGPLQSQLDSALNPAWGNTATEVATIRVPAGNTIFEGVAAGQPIRGGGSIIGGGNQVYIPRVDPAWLVGG